MFGKIKLSMYRKLAAPIAAGVVSTLVAAYPQAGDISDPLTQVIVWTIVAVGVWGAKNESDE